MKSSSSSILRPRLRPLGSLSSAAPCLLLLLLLLAIAAAPKKGLLVLVRAQFTCDIPTNGCQNGMFSVDKCVCECIPPYCPYNDGTCTLPSGNCGGNPWTECERGVNCPWWVNPLRDEGCTTGPEVPVDTWELYNTRTACCRTKFPYSDICDYTPEDTSPTKHPTISSPEDAEFEVVPIRFDLLGVPDDVRMRSLKDEMTIVLKRILIRLSERIPGMSISSVEEKAVLSDRDVRGRRTLLRSYDGGGGGEDEGRRRGLEQDVTLYYNIFIVRAEDRKFGPLIINELRDSYDDMITQIRTFSDITYFGGDLNLNLCTSQNGRFTQCLKKIAETPPPTPVFVPAPAVVYSAPEPEAGLAGWAITLIVLSCLVVLCCIGALVWAFCAPIDDSNKAVENNIYMDGEDSEHGSRRSRRLMIEDERSRRTNGDERRIVLAGPASLSSDGDDDSFTINTRKSKRRPGLEPDENAIANTRGIKSSGRDPTSYVPGKPGRDPTMYIPGQEDKPDPHADLSERDGGSRVYYEDPPVKPKRDPSMYVDGEGSSDPSMYVDGGGGGDPPLKPQRDPTLYESGRGWYDDDGDEATWSDPYRGYSQYDDPGYDNYAGVQSSVDDLEESVASKRAKKSKKKSKKSSRRGLD